jgi:hypothetical protein
MDTVHGDQQVIVTTTDLGFFDPSFLERAVVRQIHEGRIGEPRP